MKNMKKFASLLLALVMVLSLATTAFAAEADLSEHEYMAYKIFSGTQAEDSAELADVVWGDGVNGTALLAALQADDTFDTTFDACVDADDVALAMKEWGNKSDLAKAFAKLAYAHKTDVGVACKNGDTLPAGYYLVVDVTELDEDDKNTVKNLALLQLTNKDTFYIENKVDVPEVEKKVKDTNDSVANSTTNWQDSADYDIGDEIPYQLTATLGKIADYKTYKVVFHDKLTDGLTYKGGAVVKLGDKTLVKDTDYTETYAHNELTITIADAKAKGAVDGSVITVEYTATLNENAVIGAAGNPNSVYLEYSNDPNWTGEPANEPTGETPEDKVTVFTFKLVVNKVDETGDPLEGAGFTLSKWVEVTPATDEADAVYDWEVVKEIKDTTTFTWEGLDDGNYKLSETTTPAGYNHIEDIEFTITADHQIQSENPQLTNLTGPDDFAVDKAEGKMEGEIKNYKGTTLPETGGIGTTMFYVFGTIMVLAAAVLLITKKRMSVAE